MANNFNNQNNCQYFAVADFNNLNIDSSRNMFIFHHNVRSYNKNSDELLVLLSQLNTKPHIIVLTETWFSRDYFCDIPGYNSYHVCRDERRGGGVSIYVLDEFRSRKITDRCFISDICEMCSVSVSVSDTENIFIHGIYRPPDYPLPPFNHYINDMLSVVRGKCFMVGDFNLNIGNPRQVDDDFINVNVCNSMFPNITLATHKSGSVIDNIWSNMTDCIPSVFDTNITDHYPIFVSFPLRPQKNRKIVKEFRDHSEQCLYVLENRLATFVDSFTELSNIDIDSKVQILCSELYEIYDKCCPVKRFFFIFR